MKPSTGSFVAQVNLTTSKRNETFVKSFPFPCFSELKVKGYVDVNVFEAYMNKVRIRIFLGSHKILPNLSRFS